MPTAIFGGGRIRTNTPAENALNALTSANNDIANRQLRLATGKRINSASDDVAGYITSRSLGARVGSLRSALNSVGDGKNVAAIAQDGLDNINSLITQIKDHTATAASGALGTDEKVSLAKAAYRLAEQIQTVVDSTVFGGFELIKGSYSADFISGFKADNSILSINIDLDVASNSNFMFNLNSLEANNTFAGVENFNLESLNEVTDENLGVFDSGQVGTTLQSIATALNNVNITASYLGGVVNRLDSQDAALQSQITNFNAAISRIEDADVALEQLELVKSQFLQQTSVIGLAQANQSPQTFLQLLQ